MAKDNNRKHPFVAYVQDLLDRRKAGESIDISRTIAKNIFETPTIMYDRFTDDVRDWAMGLQIQASMKGVKGDDLKAIWPTPSRMRAMARITYRKYKGKFPHTKYLEFLKTIK